MHIRFASGGLMLEGELAAAAHATRAAVICHPHPQYGGDMDNPVVRAVETGLRQTRCATLRFNFRGVGSSTGAYDGGRGEVDDARAAVDCLIDRSGITAVTLAGYSFGAMVALRAGADLSSVDRLIAVAPPLEFVGLDFLGRCSKPKLFLAGDHDQYCRVASLAEQLAAVAEPKAQRLLAGADHFFRGHEEAVAAAIRSFMKAERSFV
jgi:alpha/beta superfamily hydrolase